MQTTYIFGHKVPDTDSVCASVSLSYLKNELGQQTEPRVLGSLNKETKFVLKYFKIPEPKFLNDVKVQIRNMSYNKEAMVYERVSILEAYRKVVSFGVTGLPLVDANKKLTGYINVREISKYLIDGPATTLKTSYDNIIKSLHGREILRYDDEIIGDILAAAYKSETFIDSINLDNNDILIIGDRYKIQEYALNSGIKLMIIVNNGTLPDDLMQIAIKNKVNIISVPYSTFKCSNMIKLCNYVKLININDNPITYSVYDYRDDFLESSSKYGHTNYPIVNSKNECLGMIQIIEANNYEKKKVILVDHNQQSQSADGIEEADIVEIIDHHNLGVFGTTTPINFRSMPVGCTCTIIYQLYKEANIRIPSNIAGIMLSAILSDTLLFKSPTTTELDKKTGEELAKLANVDYEKYGLEMFKAASSISDMSIEDIINCDIKSFSCEDISFTIGQVMTMDFDIIKKKEQELVSTLNTMCNVGNYKVAILFVTDIINNGSYMFYNDTASDLLKEAYNLEDIYQGVYIKNMVSRKKQMLPPLLETIEKRN